MLIHAASLTAAFALTLGGCAAGSGSDEDAPAKPDNVAITSDDPKVAPFITKQFGDCLAKVGGGEVKYESGNVWIAKSEKGTLKWRAAYGNTGDLLAFPDDATDKILDESGCYDD